MKKKKYLFFCFLFIAVFISILTVSAQEFSVPQKYAFKTIDDFKKYEADILNCIDYLEQAPVNDLSNNRKKINSFFLEWLTDVPYVHIVINSAVMDLCKENQNFLLIFMGGWTKYSLSHPDDGERTNCYLAGIESIINVYKRGNGVKEDKNILDLIKLQEEGKLREWVFNQISQ